MGHRYFSTALKHISCVLRWSGTNFSVYGSASKASLHISCVLKQSGTNVQRRGFLRTSLLHASCVPGIYFSMYDKTLHAPSMIYPITFLNESIILFIPLGLGEDVVMVNNKLITCLPRAFPVFSPFSFSSRWIYSAYVLLMVSSLDLSTLSYVHLLPNKYPLPLSMTPFKHYRFLCC